MNKPEYVVWHTAAHGDPRTGAVYDTTVEEIDRWHRQRGFRKVGYHYVVRFDGLVEKGRLEGESGAHTLGLNSKSIGICFSGHGDIKPLTDEQMSRGLQLTQSLMKKYGIDASHVIGHREVNNLILRGLVSVEYKTSKSCPGTKVNMQHVREVLGGEASLGPVGAPAKRGPFVKYGDKSADVERAQTAINKILEDKPGMEVIAEDGAFGPLTAAAFKAVYGVGALGAPDE